MSDPYPKRTANFHLGVELLLAICVQLRNLLDAAPACQSCWPVRWAWEPGAQATPQAAAALQKLGACLHARGHYSLA